MTRRGLSYEDLSLKINVPIPDMRLLRKSFQSKFGGKKQIPIDQGDVHTAFSSIVYTFDDLMAGLIPLRDLVNGTRVAKFSQFQTFLKSLEIYGSNYDWDQEPILQPGQSAQQKKDHLEMMNDPDQRTIANLQDILILLDGIKRKLLYQINIRSRSLSSTKEVSSGQSQQQDDVIQIVEFLRMCFYDLMLIQLHKNSQPVDFNTKPQGHLVLVTCGHRGKPNRLEEKKISRLLRKSGFIPQIEELYQPRQAQQQNNNAEPMRNRRSSQLKEGQKFQFSQNVPPLPSEGKDTSDERFFQRSPPQDQIILTDHGQIQASPIIGNNNQLLNGARLSQEQVPVMSWEMTYGDDEDIYLAKGVEVQYEDREQDQQMGTSNGSHNIDMKPSNILQSYLRRTSLDVLNLQASLSQVEGLALRDLE